MFVTPLSAPVRITDIIPSQDYATYENEAISLACYIAGDPTPTVSWGKVGGNIYITNIKLNKHCFSLLSYFLPPSIPRLAKTMQWRHWLTYGGVASLYLWRLEPTFLSALLKFSIWPLQSFETKMNFLKAQPKNKIKSWLCPWLG